MTLFEVMTALSATFAIAIPTFMEKVMRPKYEERFAEFREARRDSFIEEFEKALPKLKQSKQELTPETIETMESLFNEWGQVRTDENRLSVLLKYRKFFFISWFVSCALALFAIEYSTNIIIFNPLLTLGQIAGGFFVMMLFASLWYGYELFILDEKLSKIKSNTTGEQFGKSEPVTARVKLYYTAEKKVEDALVKFGFPYQKDTRFNLENSNIITDFSIPKEMPKYVIEVKAGRVMDFQRLVRTYQLLKQKVNVNTILVMDYYILSGGERDFLKKGFDYVLDFTELEKLKDVVKL